MHVIFNRFFKTQRLGGKLLCRPPPAPRFEEQNLSLEVYIIMVFTCFWVGDFYLFLALGFLLVFGFRVFFCFWVHGFYLFLHLGMLGLCFQRLLHSLHDVCM